MLSVFSLVSSVPIGIASNFELTAVALSEKLPGMSPAPSIAPISTDVPCMICHYNLRTRLPTDLCPECGQPVQPSLLFHSSFPRPALTIIGLSLLSLAFAMRTVVSVLSVFELFWIPLAMRASTSLFFVVLIVSGGAAIVRASRHSDAMSPRCHFIARLLLIIYALFAIPSALFSALFIAAAAAPFPFAMLAHLLENVPNWAAITFNTFASLALLALYAGSTLYFPRIAANLLSPLIKKLGAVLFFAAFIFHVVLIGYSIVLQYLASKNANASIDLYISHAYALHLVGLILDVTNVALYASITAFVLIFAIKVWHAARPSR